MNTLPMRETIWSCSILPRNPCSPFGPRTAEEVRLNLYASGEGGEPIRQLPMKSSDKGTWRISVSEDLKGSFYTFQIRIGDKWLDETPGIWAKAVGVNGNRAAVITGGRSGGLGGG